MHGCGGGVFARRRRITYPYIAIIPQVCVSALATRACQSRLSWSSWLPASWRRLRWRVARVSARAALSDRNALAPGETASRLQPHAATSPLQVRETAQTHVAAEQAVRHRVDSDLLLRRWTDTGSDGGGQARSEPGPDEDRAAGAAPSVSEDGGSAVLKRSGASDGAARHRGHGDMERALSGAESSAPSPTLGGRMREDFWAVFLETVLHNRSTAVVCLAGFCANLLTGEALHLA